MPDENIILSAAAGLGSEVTSLGRFLGSAPQFAVPPFQRNYDWTEAEYGSFWDDVLDVTGNETGRHILGFIVTSHAAAEQPQLIDGQQRMATSLILLSALRAHLLDAGLTTLADQIESDYLNGPKKFLFTEPKLVLNQHDRAFFNRFILARQPISKLIDLSTEEHQPPSNQRMAKCYVFMSRKIAEYADTIHKFKSTRPKSGQAAKMPLQTLAGQLITALIDKLIIVTISVSDDFNAYRIFEALNDRGLELSEADLIKNHIFSVARGQCDIVEKSWEEMSDNLGRITPAKFIRHHWMSTTGPIAKKGILQNIKTRVTTDEEACSYVHELTQSARPYGALNDPRHIEWKSRLFRNNKHVARIRKDLQFIECLHADQLMVVLLASLEAAPTYFAEMLDLMKIFTFRFSTICTRPPSEITPLYIQAAAFIRNQPDQATARTVFERFLAAKYPSDEEFIKNFKNRTIRNNKMLARTILAEINDAISDVPSLTTCKDPDETDLEHILPINYQQHWPIEPDQFPGGVARYRYRIGNMTLLASRLNNGIGNQGFDVKKAEAYAKDPLAINQQILQQDKWGAEEIEARQSWMAEIAVKIWRFE